MSESGFEMWELVASIIGTVFLLPLLYALLTGGFPSTKIRALDALLTETETLLHTALAEGTIEYSYYKRKIEERIFQYVHLHHSVYCLSYDSRQEPSVVRTSSVQRSITSSPAGKS